MAGERQGCGGGHSHLQCKGSQWPAEVVFHAGPLTPASALPMHPWSSASHWYPCWDWLSRPAHPLSPPAPWPPPGMLLTPSLWDCWCPLCPVAPTALEMHPQIPTKTRILPGTHAHPLPPTQDLPCMAPTWPWLQAAPGEGVCSVPRLCQPCSVPRSCWGSRGFTCLLPTVPMGTNPT